MKGRVFGFAQLIIIILFSGFSVEAVNTLVWETKSQHDFSKGELEGVSITSEGEVVLSPKLTSILNTEDPELFTWDLAMDASENIYVATGNNGRIFKISKDGKASLFFDSPEVAILSLAIDAEGYLYAGSSPDGVIYKIDPQGTYRAFFNTGETYVWALVLDRSDNVLAATGDKGRIYKISQDGTSRILFDSGQTHVTALISDGRGGFYAGSEGDGVVYHISSTGKVSVLYDAEENEIRTLALDQHDNLYVGALASRTISPPPREGKPPEERDKEKRSTKTSSIYKISSEGVVSKIWHLPSHFIYSLMVDNTNNLLVGTDDRSMIYKISPEGEVTSFFRTDRAQALSFLQGTDSDIYLGTGDTAMVYKVDFHPRETGALLSSIHDTQGISRWGKISWKGSSQGIKFLTRTGNTEKPDSTWSSWSGPYTTMTGTDITSPPARFIQWKAILSATEEANSPVLREVAVYYLPRNLSPRISKIVVTSPGEERVASSTSRETTRSDERNEKGDGKGSSTSLPTPSRGIKVEKGQKGFSWIAEDPNQDTLTFELYFRGEGEKNWKLLAENISETVYRVNTESLPDGWYQLKVLASDASSNPADKALTTERTSEFFLIDNTSPVVKVISVQQQDSTRNFLVSIQASDSSSLLRDAQYSVDGGEWKTIFPKDEIFDSQEEEFLITVENLSVGEHSLIFRVKDSEGNIGAGKTVIQVD